MTGFIICQPGCLIYELGFDIPVSDVIVYVILVLIEVIRIEIDTHITTGTTIVLSM